MTPYTDAFVRDLQYLCRQYRFDLYVDVEYDGPRFVIASLAPGEEPLRWAVWEDETTGPSRKQE
jgi:hypothetical protein